MNKEDLIKKAQSYTKDKVHQRAYIAGFIAASNIIRDGLENKDMDDLYNIMQQLSDLCFIDFDDLLFDFHFKKEEE